MERNLEADEHQRRLPQEMLEPALQCLHQGNTVDQWRKRDHFETEELVSIKMPLFYGYINKCTSLFCGYNNIYINYLWGTIIYICTPFILMGKKRQQVTNWTLISDEIQRNSSTHYFRTNKKIRHHYINELQKQKDRWKRICFFFWTVQRLFGTQF